MNVVVPRWLQALGLTALVLTACRSERSGSADTAEASASSVAAVSSAVSSAAPPPAPLSSTPPLPPPRSVPVAGVEAGIPGAHVVYAQTRDPADGVKLVGVDPERHRALLEIGRSGTDAPLQLVTVDFARGDVVEAWSPSQALARIASAENARGPSLADELDAGAALRADLIGWSQRLAATGSPWTDGLLATAPGAKYVLFPSGHFLCGLGPSGTPYVLGALGSRGPGGAVLSPDGGAAAWWGIVDHVRGARQRVVIGSLAAGGNPEAIAGLTEPEAVTWSRDGARVYLFATAPIDGGSASGCFHSIDAKTHAAKMLMCVPGGGRGVALSPDGRLALLSSRSTDARPGMDLVWLDLSDGRVKRQLRMPVVADGMGLLDDKGLFVTTANSRGPVVTAVDLATGRTKLARYDGDPLHVGDWIGPRSFLGLRTTKDMAVLERIDVDALVATKVV
jgi:hypothetical protein